MNETIEGLGSRFLKWKEAFESKGLQVNLGKPKVMASGSISRDSMSNSKVDPCGVCSLTVMAASQGIACLIVKLILVGSVA